MRIKRCLAVVGLLTSISLLGIYSPLFASNSASGPNSASRALAQPMAQRIVFAQGSTSAAVSGSLAVSTTDYWVLTVLAGQTMTAQLNVPNTQAILIVWGADGNVLQSDHATSNTFSGVVPSTQDYFIAVESSPSGPVNYTLTITIPPLASPPPASTRIQFAPGATSATVNGTVATSGSQTWVLTAFAGQTMTAQLNVPNTQAILIIYGANDGNVLQSDHATSNSFSGTLPTTEDYYIEVRGAPTGGTAYSLTVTIPPLPGSPTQPTPQRITFPVGGTSASVNGQLAINGMDRWTIRALAGQSMSAQLTFSTGQAILIVFGVDGTVLLSDHVGASSFNGVLPSTQDYYIDVRGNPYNATSYTLTVTIPPLTAPPSTGRRITFAPGGDSGAVQGQVTAGGLDRWTVRAAGGQTLMAQIVYSTQPLVIVVWGADGTVLLSDHAGATSFTGVLPSTQDYYIDVKGNPAGTTAYTLNVVIPPQ